MHARDICRLAGKLIIGGFDGAELPERYARALREGLRGGAILFVDSNPDNPVIGDRSFGADPDLVAACAVAFLEGIGASGVLACGNPARASAADPLGVIDGGAIVIEGLPTEPLIAECEQALADPSSPLIYVASAAKLGRTTEEYRRILRKDDRRFAAHRNKSTGC
jgi:Glycosyl hydrolase family 3 N terminal domain